MPFQTISKDAAAVCLSEHCPISLINASHQQELLRLTECARTQTGEVLNYYSMLNTHRAGIRIWPTAYVNGQFFDRSYPLETEICRHTNWC